MIAKGILNNVECSDTGKLTVEGVTEPCKIAFYTVDILAGRRYTGKVFNLLCGVTESGKQLTNDECLKILSYPVVNYEESGRKHACWLKSHSPGKMDRLVPLDEFIEQSIQDSNSAQAEEIDRMKLKATTDKNALEHTLQDLRTAITDVEKQLEAESSDRMARLTLSRKLGEAKNNLMQKEESIYFDAMRIDLACEEDIKKFLEREQINARLMRHFELEITGRS